MHKATSLYGFFHIFRGLTFPRLLHGKEKTFFADEINLERKHDRIGVVSTANPGPNLNHYEVIFCSAVLIMLFF